MSPSSAPAPVSPNQPTPTTGMDLKFLPDDPIRNAEQDLFKLHGSYAKALKNIVMGCPTPFVVGLSGPWGSGKTTVIEMLKQELHKREQSVFWFPERGRVPVVILDVSQFSDASLRRWILFEIQDQLRQQEIKGFKPFRDKSGRTLQDNLERTIQEDSRHPVGQHILYLAGWFAASALAWWGLGYVPHLGSKRKDIAAAIAGAGLWDRLGALLRNGQSYVIDFLFARRTITTAPTFSPEQFHRLFRKMVSDATSNHSQRLVLCFDNLDRATGKVAIEVLQTIKAFLNEGKCVCVLPCDEEAMLRHLTAVYSEECQDSGGNYPRENAARLASEYLQKYFNVVLRLPEFHQSDIRSYTDSLVNEAGLTADEGTKTVIACAYGGETPRQIKRFLNDVVAQLMLFQNLDLSDSHPLRISGGTAIIAKLLAIRSRWPSSFEALAVDPRNAERWNTAAATEQRPLDIPTPLFQFLVDSAEVPIPADTVYYRYLKQVVKEEDVLRPRLLAAINKDDYSTFKQVIQDQWIGPSALILIDDITEHLKSRHAQSEVCTLLRYLLRLQRDSPNESGATKAEKLASWLFGPPNPFRELGRFNNEACDLAQLITNAQVERKNLLSNWVVARFQELPLAEVERATLTGIAKQPNVLSDSQEETVGRSLAKSIRDGGEQRLSALKIVEQIEDGPGLWPQAVPPVVDTLIYLIPTDQDSWQLAVPLLWQLMPRAQDDAQKLRFAELLDRVLERGENSEIKFWIGPIESPTGIVPIFRFGEPATEYLVERFPAYLKQGQINRVAHTIALMVELLPFLDTSGVIAVDEALVSKINSALSEGAASLYEQALRVRSEQVLKFLPRTSALLRIPNAPDTPQ